MGITSFLFVFAFSLGVKCIAGFDCNVTTEATQCYNDLVHFEGLGFPLYGKNEEMLNDTCSLIYESFDCIEVYADLCRGSPTCDEACLDLLHDIDGFQKNTRLRDLGEELCIPNKPLRKTYLENYKCLESNADHYAKCHNESQISLEFIATIQDSRKSAHARCCFLSWYHDCFTNITRDNCETNATFFISFSLYKLVVPIKNHVCGNKLMICDKPPPLTQYETYEVITEEEEHSDFTTDAADNTSENEVHASASACSWSAKFVAFAYFIFVISMHIF